MTFKLQDPSDTLNYRHDWSDFLAEGESIASRVWSIDPDGSPSVLSNTTSESVTVSGLAKGKVYLLTEQITTSIGNVAQRSFPIRCEEY